jgi:tRNA G37 N-methylase Trm5
VDLNKVKKSVHTYCMDGKEFIRWVNSSHPCRGQDKDRDISQSSDIADQPVAPSWEPPHDGLVWHHAVMNLPRTAVEFCDAFAGSFDDSVWQNRNLPLVHCYSFQKNETEAGMLLVSAYNRVPMQNGHNGVLFHLQHRSSNMNSAVQTCWHAWKMLWAGHWIIQHRFIKSGTWRPTSGMSA